LGTAGKVAIGCGIAVLIAGIVGIMAVGGLAWWAKGKAEEFTSEQHRIEELHRKANANRFTAPAGGVVSEDRLQKFLDVRRRVYAVYERHKDELDAMSKKKQGDFGDVRKGFALINELRLAQAQALADLGMSEDEYRFLVEQIYKSMWASAAAKSASPTASPAPAGDVSAPPANVALFKRYEADITKYAMGGLEWVGL
jgi:hypothetical protein